MKAERLLIRLRMALATILVVFAGITLASESGSSKYAENDARFERLLANTNTFQTIVEIDHARLAQQAGVKTMPPSRVLVFSNPEVTTRALQADLMLGLEFPYRVLAYEDESGPGIAYADESFLRARHGLNDSVSLEDYSADMRQSIDGFDQNVLRPVTAESVSAGYGIITINSDFDFQTTIGKVKQAIMSQGDTVWFGTVDFSKDAEALGIELPSASMLLFGGPGPGGMAMSQYPKLGLDAFCQKILVLQQADAKVSLHFNDIVALAELHYASSNKPQAVINQRLMSTLTQAVSKPGDNTEQNRP